MKHPCVLPEIDRMIAAEQEIREDWKAMTDPTPITDPLLDGTQPCANCGVAGQIGYGFDVGYWCGACGSNDSDE